MMRLPPLPLLHGKVEDRQKYIDDFIGDEESPKNWRGHRADDLGADARGPEHGSDREDRRPFGEELRPESVDGSVEDRFLQLGHGPDPFKPPALLDGLAEIHKHDDAGLRRHAEAGDVADPDGDREV